MLDYEKLLWNLSVFLWCILREIPQEHTKAKTILGCASQRAADAHVYLACPWRFLDLFCLVSFVKLTVHLLTR